jgi:hypothetical protein
VQGTRTARNSTIQLLSSIDSAFNAILSPPNSTSNTFAWPPAPNTHCTIATHAGGTPSQVSGSTLSIVRHSRLTHNTSPSQPGRWVEHGSLGLQHRYIHSNSCLRLHNEGCVCPMNYAVPFAMCSKAHCAFALSATIATRLPRGDFLIAETPAKSQRRKCRLHSLTPAHLHPNPNPSRPS